MLIITYTYTITPFFIGTWERNEQYSSMERCSGGWRAEWKNVGTPLNDQGKMKLNLQDDTDKQLSTTKRVRRLIALSWESSMFTFFFSWFVLYASLSILLLSSFFRKAGTQWKYSISKTCLFCAWLIKKMKCRTTLLLKMDASWKNDNVCWSFVSRRILDFANFKIFWLIAEFFEKKNNFKKQNVLIRILKPNCYPNPNWKETVFIQKRPTSFEKTH